MAARLPKLWAPLLLALLALEFTVTLAQPAGEPCNTVQSELTGPATRSVHLGALCLFSGVGRRSHALAWSGRRSKAALSGPQCA